MKLAKISTKIDEKWDKNKNNGFGFDGQNLIIKSQHFEWKSMKNQWKLNEISGKIQRKLEPIWAQNQLKISYFWYQILYYPLLKIHRKSAQIDNKFMKNQWNLNQILNEIQRNWL